MPSGNTRLLPVLPKMACIFCPERGFKLGFRVNVYLNLTHALANSATTAELVSLQALVLGLLTESFESIKKLLMKKWEKYNQLEKKTKIGTFIFQGKREDKGPEFLVN